MFLFISVSEADKKQQVRVVYNQYCKLKRFQDNFVQLTGYKEIYIHVQLFDGCLQIQIVCVHFLSCEQ